MSLSATNNDLSEDQTRIETFSQSGSSRYRSPSSSSGPRFRATTVLVLPKADRHFRRLIHSTGRQHLHKAEYSTRA